MMKLRIVSMFVGFGAAVFVGTSAPVWAQNKSRTDAAEEAIQSAMAFANEGNFAAACPLLERANELDPTERTSFALADCRDREGKTATALKLWRQFSETFENPNHLPSDKRQFRLETAKGRIAVLQAEVSRVKFVCDGGDCTAAKLFIDGAPAAPTAMLELDPGEHRMIASWPNTERQMKTFEVKRAQPLMELHIEQKKPHAENAADNVIEKPSVNPRSSPKDQFTGQRLLGIVGISLGGSAIIAGGIMGGLALAQKGKVDSECSPQTNFKSCTPAGIDAMYEGRMLGNVATVPLFFGVALAAAGVVITVQNPKVTATAGLGTMHDGTPFFSIQGKF